MLPADFTRTAESETPVIVAQMAEISASGSAASLGLATLAPRVKSRSSMSPLSNLANCAVVAMSHTTQHTSRYPNVQGFHGLREHSRGTGDATQRQTTGVVQFDYWSALNPAITSTRAGGVLVD